MLNGQNASIRIELLKHGKKLFAVLNRNKIRLIEQNHIGEFNLVD